MLKSKYLTQTGVTEMFQYFHKRGLKYIFFNPDRNVFQVSQEKPYFRNDIYMCCDGYRENFVDGFFVLIVKDLLYGLNYIDIAEELGIVDWSAVKIDTPVLVYDNHKDFCAKRYFAKYENGKIYTWKDGTTSWTADSPNFVTEWKNAELVK